MKICKTLALPLGGALLASAASAQIVYGTSNASGDDNFLLDIGSTVSTGPVYSGAASWGLADDDTNQLLYSSVSGAVSSSPYAAPAAVTFVVNPADSTGGAIRSEAMVFSAGMLFAASEFGGTSLEGIYSIDLVTGLGTAEFIYPNSTEVDFGGIDEDPATGLFYGASDDTDTRGVNVIDIVADTSTMLAPYPTGVFDVDGCAFNPNGTFYLIQDENNPIDVYDLATNAYTGTLPTAVSISNTFSAGTFTDLITISDGIGTAICDPANANSTGAPGVLVASGSIVAADNDLTLIASNLPPGEFGLLVNSMNVMAAPFFPIGNGLLCIGPGFGRHISTFAASDAAGMLSNTVDLTALPRSSTPTEPALAGQTWYFQLWHRDAASSNLTNAVEILFQ